MTRARDMDLIRKLMLDIEGGVDEFDRDDYAAYDLDEKAGLTEEERSERVRIHLDLLADAGFVEFEDQMQERVVERITWAGADFLDAVRDPAIWSATKEGAKRAGGFTVDLVVALAKGFIRKRVEDMTGITLDI